MRCAGNQRHHHAGARRHRRGGHPLHRLLLHVAGVLAGTRVAADRRDSVAARRARLDPRGQRGRAAHRLPRGADRCSPTSSPAAGYRCGLVGKWHLGASDVPRPGYVKWFAHQSGMSPYYDAPMVDETAPVTVAALPHRRARPTMRSRSCATRRRAPSRSGSASTTRPRTIRGSTRIRSEFTDLYADCAFAVLPAAKPPHPWIGARQSGDRRGLPSSAREPHRLLRGDDRDGRRASGACCARSTRWASRSSTLVIFMSDNGMNCGHHGIWGKGNGTRPQNMYDTSVKVPCLIAQPGRIAPGGLRRPAVRPTTCFRRCSTISASHDAAGAAAPGPQLPRAARRERAARTIATSSSTTSTGRCAWCARASGNTCIAIPDGPHELYDLARDPDERTNLVDAIRNAPTTVDAACGARLDAWFARYRRPGPRRRAQARHRVRPARSDSRRGRRQRRLPRRPDRAAGRRGAAGVNDRAPRDPPARRPHAALTPLVPAAARSAGSALQQVGDDRLVAGRAPTSSAPAP